LSHIWSPKTGIRRKYAIYLASLASLLLLNQAFIQFSLSRKEDDAKVLNIAGRQRMLSQKLNLYYYSYRDSPTQGQDSVLAVSNAWKEGHYALLYGNEELGIKAIKNRKARRHLENLTYFIEYNHRIAVNWKNRPQVDHRVIDPKQADFLKGMEIVVNELEKDATGKLVFLVIMELILAAISIGALYFEFKFLIYPLTRDLSQKVEQLKIQNRKLEHVAFFQNHLLREPLTTLIMLVTAIEKEKDPDKKLELLSLFPSLLEKIDKVTCDIVEEVNLK
jgi:nitrate/nitrite-specific signal transduction histidine kinase